MGDKKKLIELTTKLDEKAQKLDQLYQEFIIGIVKRIRI